jgi:hypothetical protein
LGYYGPAKEAEDGGQENPTVVSVLLDGPGLRRGTHPLDRPGKEELS